MNWSSFAQTYSNQKKTSPLLLGLSTYIGHSPIPSRLAPNVCWLFPPRPSMHQLACRFTFHVHWSNHQFWLEPLVCRFHPNFSFPIYCEVTISEHKHPWQFSFQASHLAAHSARPPKPPEPRPMWWFTHRELGGKNTLRCHQLLGNLCGLAMFFFPLGKPLNWMEV